MKEKVEVGHEEARRGTRSLHSPEGAINPCRTQGCCACTG
jgi:hypothetical protein